MRNDVVGDCDLRIGILHMALPMYSDTGMSSDVQEGVNFSWEAVATILYNKSFESSKNIRFQKKV